MTNNALEMKLLDGFVLFLGIVFVIIPELIMRCILEVRDWIVGGIYEK